MFRLRVLSLHPAASAIGRVFIQGIAIETERSWLQSPLKRLPGFVLLSHHGPFLNRWLLPAFDRINRCRSIRNTQAHAVPYMSASRRNDYPALRVGMEAPPKDEGSCPRSGRSLIVPVRSLRQEPDATCLGHVTPEDKNFKLIRVSLLPQCPSSFRQIAGLRCTSCQPLPAPFYLPSSNNI